MILEVKDLAYKYPKVKEETIKDINFSLQKGQIMCILGPNGSGKTTLLNCLANLLTPSKGTIKVGGKSIRSMSRREAAKEIGYVPQFHNAVYAYTIREFVTMGRTPYLDILGTPKKKDLEIANEAISKMKIDHLAHKKYTNLSGGEKQQAMIARVLVQNPKIIMLDEPTNHLDYGNQIRALKMIKELSQQGYTIIMTTHNPDHALMLEDKAAIIDYGSEFIFGDSKDVLTEDKLSKIYGLNLEMIYIKEKDKKICITSI